MQTRTGIRAGITAAELVQNAQDTVWETQQVIGNAAQGVRDTAQGIGDAASGAVQGVQQLWFDANAGDALNRLFWFPLDPPQ
jgi:hypothetical protein